jgi:hypothetical protein
MKIVAYKKHLNYNNQLVDPPWIVRGDMFYEENSKTYIGLVFSEEERDYYIPDSVDYITKEELTERLRPLHEIRPFQYKVNGIRTPCETIEEFIEHWWDRNYS